MWIEWTEVQWQLQFGVDMAHYMLGNTKQFHPQRGELVFKVKKRESER